MIWASFGWDYKSKISIGDGRLNAQSNKDLLKYHLDEISGHFGN